MSSLRAWGSEGFTYLEETFPGGSKDQFGKRPLSFSKDLFHQHFHRRQFFNWSSFDFQGFLKENFLLRKTLVSYHLPAQKTTSKINGSRNFAPEHVNPTWMSQEVRINGERISGLCHPNSSPIYK